MDTQYITLIPFLILMVLFALLNSGGKKKYGAMLQALDKKEYNLKDFMPAGFALMGMTRYDYSNNLDRTLRRQLAALSKQSGPSLAAARYQKFRKMGAQPPKETP